MIKKIYLKILQRINPIKYAKKIGVNLVGEGQKFISTNFGSEPWLITIGSHVELSGNVTFITHDGAPWIFRKSDVFKKYKSVKKFGKIIVEDNCFIGINTTILPGVRIGPNSIIGACSLVLQDVPPNSVVAGCPTRFICSVEQYGEKLLHSIQEYDESSLLHNKKEEVLKVLENRLK